ncbi:MAG: hypothetical protein M3P98_02800 [bacterium]|nr:hypothetical protein [bacterium]
MNQAFKIGVDEYETVPDEARIATEYLLKLKEKFGIPEEAELEDNNKIILIYAFEIFKTWAALYPEEHHEFILATEFELKYERPVKDAVKAGGYSPIAYPARLDSLYHVLLPKVKTQDKRFWMPLLKTIPELRRTNYFK